MIDFSTGYTKAEIQQQMLDQVDNKYDKREGSLIQTAVGPGAWALEGFALLLKQIQDSGSVLYAVGDDLNYIVANRGITRIAATYAVREGTFDMVIPPGSVFKTLNGNESVLFTSGTLISSGGGIWKYELTCQTAGPIGNAYSGNITPVSAGLTSLTVATIGTIISVGAAEESDAALRARYIESFTAAPYGGNIPEYRQAVLKVPGVGGVQVYPANSYNGGGTVLISICSDTFGAADASLVSDVQDAICPGSPPPSPDGYGIAPVGAAVDVVSCTELTLDMSFTATFASGVVNGEVTYHDEIVEAIDAYIKEVAKDWGSSLRSYNISYPVVIYAARVIAAILTIPEVVNVTSLLINGVSGDITLTETSSTQEIPVLGEVTINV